MVLPRQGTALQRPHLSPWTGRAVWSVPDCRGDVSCSEALISRMELIAVPTSEDAVWNDELSYVKAFEHRLAHMCAQET